MLFQPGVCTDAGSQSSRFWNNFGTTTGHSYANVGQPTEPTIRARQWHTRGMARARISTTVDSDLLDRARHARATANDAELIDEALAALLANDRAAEIDATYAAGYAEHPLDEPDEWGDLASFRQAAGR